MQSGTVVGQGSLYERQCDQLHILPRSQSRQEGVERRRDHVLQFGDKKIGGWRGIHRVFSMWMEGVSDTRGEIVPGRFQMDRVVWARVSERGKEFGDWWLLTKPYLRLSTGRNSGKTVLS